MFRENMRKAKALHKYHLREKRKDAFAKLDAQYMMAQEDNDTDAMEAIKQKKRVLRDLPAASEITSATCINDLRNHWPEELDCVCPYTQAEQSGVPNNFEELVELEEE